jgi:lipopolysaccharide transport system permease protein
MYKALGANLGVVYYKKLFDKLSKVMEPFLFLWRQRHLILHTTLNDIKARYTGSSLGLMWAVLNPLLLFCVYVVVFLLIFKVHIPEITSFEYTLLILAGLVPWFGFSESIMACVYCVVGNANLLHSSSFPVSALPVKAVLASMFSQATGLIILMIALLITGRVSLYWFYLPVAIGVQLFFSIGLGYFLSVLNVFVKDLAQCISTLLLLLMFLSPIAYLPDMLQGFLRFFLYLNPIAYMIMLYRDPLFYGKMPMPFELTISIIISIGIFCAGYRFFERIRPYLVDHV